MLILFFSRADYRAAFYRLPLGKSLLARDLAYFSFLPLCSPNCFAAFYAVLCYAINCTERFGITNLGLEIFLNGCIQMARQFCGK